MRTSLTIAMLAAGMILIGYLGQELGITTTLISAPTIVEPGGGGGFWDSIRAVLAPFIWGFNAIGSFVQIMFFQADIPPLANALIFLPISFFMGWTLLRLIRG